MKERPSYKTTLFDRHGPDAANYIRSAMYSVVAGALSFPAFLAGGVALGLGLVPYIAFVVLGPAAVMVVAYKASNALARGAGEAVHVLLEGNNTTPYIQQHSYQQSLVMRGRLDEALESLEAIIAEPESSVDVRIRAAELYAREARKFDRAAELFHDATRHPKCTAGEEVYAANRLADLFSGPLAQPGRALVELRRLADRHAGSPAGAHALEALRRLKRVQAGEEADLYSKAE